MTNDGGRASEPTSYDLQPPIPVPAAPGAAVPGAPAGVPAGVPIGVPAGTPPYGTPPQGAYPRHPAPAPAPAPAQAHAHAPAPGMPSQAMPPHMSPQPARPHATPPQGAPPHGTPPPGPYVPTALHNPATAAPAATPDPGTGRLLGGRYRLVSRLGHGGMGTVWKARDEVVDRDVAVKEPRVPDHLSEQHRQNVHLRMQREARAAARIDHPSVVTVHDVVVEDGRPWIVMELVRGRSLGDQLTEGTLDPREAARIGLDVLNALTAAHEAGVLHRDVKPDNVLLGRNERVVLTDFGIAQIEGEQGLTETGGFVGSPEYVAPERVLGRRPGPESDLWSLGVVLYAAVEGVSPFRRSNTPATLQTILSAEPQVPARGAGALGTLIMQLLRKDPAARPTAPEVRQALESVARPTTPQPLAYAPAAAPVTGSRWVPPVLHGNRKAQWGLGGGVVAVAAAATLLIVNPFAVGPAVPLHWKVRDEPEAVKASLAVPEDYTKNVNAAEGWVQFSDPSGVFVITFSRETPEIRTKNAGLRDPKDIASATDEAKRIAERYRSDGGHRDALNDSKSTTSKAPSHQGLQSAGVTTVYRKSGDNEDAPKRLRRDQVFVNDDKTAVWTLEVGMPEKGEGRKDGDKLFENVVKYLKIQE
ncbi:serine/threonine-protein kinase [Streptomyces albireticuli]|uniref:non-specific serine/threonine protein kinase n=1 Tax=Streptomyces albireticuli TaxID=1940 RepID=A0A2A2D303_9ACTN|nr:serine/threonine-protein kinase [Streptomyces albireticuli]MCD9142873.1 serine/threonine protein kinase [Streptomyces albireticuli]MCD9162808.1 serine/threonine protein kinase [Streptomyces albireticuli]MCD9192368.1 serine/threonine protein kinase [Streptomyces albireticuli]PAU45891.1 serine/threonine protein kinase [Streptomyces albireticuli]